MRRLGLAIISLHTKFEMSTITCNEDMKGSAKYVEILFLSHPLGDLGVTHRVHLWLDVKRIIDFQQAKYSSRRIYIG